ncbi:hypothetical protein I5V28_13875 [Stenotrophomonas maltophilia]|uniref:hypothetical protein n=1 Tax=Stenotrophomonas maltophilia group sp. Smal32 TaxID=3377164 RepID=UPI0018D31FDB|nr:hypothetical protein [Stenotrophomonas maltophilia]MBH1746904.1 hypothetical protein [Stenotrophomonas maltophilia]
METFAPPLTSECCLCGSKEALSGEHKIKASALRAVFGKQGMVIAKHGGPYRFAQSPSSKALHFSARVCEVCNNSRTQPADLAFDQFNARALELMALGSNPADVFKDPRFIQDGPLYLDVFRYFAKLMCCHLAEMSAPSFEDVAGFAIGANDDNFILLTVDADVAFERLRIHLPEMPYAAHGGLAITGDRDSLAPASFYSTLTIGPVRYRYQVRLNEIGQARLMIEHPAFYDWCARRVEDAIKNPMSDEDSELLGLAVNTPDHSDPE